jgi:hypothetical protein
MSVMAYDEVKANRVCELLAAREEARSLRQACVIAEVKASTFLFWCDTQPDLAKRYAAADKIATDLAFEEFSEANDEQPVMGERGIDTGWVAWQRMRLDNKKWEMAKRRPSKYSEKVQQEITGADGGPVQFVSKSILEG